MKRRPRADLDRCDQVAGRDLAETLQAGQPLLGQLEYVGDVGDQPLVEEAKRLLLAQPVDLHRPFADEVLDVLIGLARAAGAVGADREDAVFRLHGLGPAGRALLRRLRPPGPLRPPLEHRRDNLGDDVAGPHHHHLVALADVLAGQVLLVVEGRGGDGDAADVDGLEHREGQQVAGAADVPDDLSQLRRRGRRRELPGDRPARLAPHHAKLAPERPLVDLDDDAVDLEVELVPAILPPDAALDHGVDSLVVAGVGVDLEAVLAKPLDLVGVGGEVEALGRA